MLMKMSDSFLAIRAFKELEVVRNKLTLLRIAINMADDSFMLHLPMTRGVINSILEDYPSQFEKDQQAFRLKTYIKDIIRPMIVYYFERFNEADGILLETVNLFKDLQIFDPLYLQQKQFDVTLVDKLNSYKVFKPFCDKLIQELPVLMQKLNGITEISDVLVWFGQRKDELPT